MYWYQHFSNFQGLLGGFSVEPAGLPSAEIVQLELADFNRVRLVIEFCEPIPGIPTRWVEKGFTSLQLRMAFSGVSTISVEKLPTDTLIRLEIVVANGIVVLRRDNQTEVLRLVFLNAFADWYPYRSSEHDGKPLWSR